MEGGNVGETQKQEYGVWSREQETNAEMEITIDREGGGERWFARSNFESRM